VSRTSTGSSSPPSPAGQVPTRPEEIERTLDELGVRPTRSMGQSFLTDRFVADALATLAVPPEGVPVFEVGGGLGIVTEALLRRGIRGLTVVERDRRLAEHLRRTFGAAIDVKVADALEFPFPSEAVVAGSLPYAIATPLLLRRMAARTRRLAVIVQKEVAERFGASPGTRAYGRPTILARLFGEVELFQEVPPAAFSPRPKVASRLMTHDARRGELPVASVPRLERLVRVLFSSRRKQLGNLLPRVGVASIAPNDLARAAGWPDDWERLRPEALPPEAFFRLERAMAAVAGTGRGID
jgi:16S rRNA (adenine1518-N6/adenine1519-N6)-dimethyltransferase